MNRPSTSIDRFIATVGRSRLLPAERLKNVAAASAEEMARQLIAAGEITPFQAGKLLAGQWQGLVLGSYRILRPLGKGGMGIVYLARDATAKAAHPLVALKILPPKKALAEPRTRERFLREMEIGNAVPNVPNIATVFNSGTVDGVDYIAMEYAPGETVKAAVAACGPLPVGDVARIFVGVATALSAAHMVGLIHRDIKPSNIIITPDGDAKLLDFGFALRLGEPLPEDRRIIGGPGYALGTIDYMPPEQAIDASAVGPQSDLYSLGCSLYYALAGCPPFPGGTTMQKVHWHRREAPPPLRAIRPEVPAEFAALIDKLMAKPPEARYPDAYSVADALRQWASDTPTVIVPAEPPVEVPADEPILDADATGERPVVTARRRLPPWFWTVAGAGLIAAAMAAGFAVNLWRR